MNEQRNRSKASRRKGWPYDEIGGRPAAGIGGRAARIAATKKTSKRKRLQAKLHPPTPTEATAARKAEKVKAAARKVFEAFLATPEASAMAREPTRLGCGLVYAVRQALRELTRPDG